MQYVFENTHEQRDASRKVSVQSNESKDGCVVESRGGWYSESSRIVIELHGPITVAVRSLNCSINIIRSGERSRSVAIRSFASVSSDSRLFARSSNTSSCFAALHSRESRDCTRTWNEQRHSTMGSVYSYLFPSSDEGEIDPSTGLTAKQKKIVRECWDIVEGHALEIGVEIMTAFFHEYPKYQDAFPTFRGRGLSELAQDRKFHAHCLTIMSTLGQAIEFIRDAELCVAGLHMTGERHARRGQDTISFDLLEPIVNNILKTRLGAKCTGPVSEALDIAVTLVFNEIKRGIDEHDGKEKRING